MHLNGYIILSVVHKHFTHLLTNESPFVIFFNHKNNGFFNRILFLSMVSSQPELIEDKLLNGIKNRFH
jgi:hypothetical protein